MRVLLLLILPLGLPALMAWFWDASRRNETWRSFFMGALLSVPALLLWLVLGFMYRPVWGSALLPLGFLLRFWVLPYGFMALAWILTRGMGGLARGEDYRKLVGFTFGFMTVFNIAHAASLWGESYMAWTILLPLLLAASALHAPVLLEECARDGMPDAVKWIGLMAVSFILASLSLSLLFLRVEWLGIILGLAYIAGASYLGLHRAAKRH